MRFVFGLITEHDQGPLSLVCMKLGEMICLKNGKTFCCRLWMLPGLQMGRGENW